MQGKQEKITSQDGQDRAEPEGVRMAPSISESENEVGAVYYNLIERVLSDDNIGRALKQVVGNHGAPGVDDMTVDELVQWLPGNIEDLRAKILRGKYKPKPVRRVEIPKPDGGTRDLGVPTVVDRLIQQAIAQILVPIYEEKFSDNSMGFRPGRSAHDAINRAKGYYEEGYRYVVDLDLSKYFDTINHDMLMHFVRETSQDVILNDLIKRFLKSGVVLPDGLQVRTEEGSPQGGPLSPLLSNIYLDKFDKELERRGHKFVRYADDVNIYVKSKRAAERVMESVTEYLEGTLKLKVNREKSAVGSPTELKFLGFKLYSSGDNVRVTIHPKSIRRFKDKIREMTKRNRGISPEAVIQQLSTYIVGWMGYYRIGMSSSRAMELDGWIRRKLRVYVLKTWKRSYTKAKNLIQLCPEYLRCPNGAPSKEWLIRCWAVAKRNGYWKASSMWAVSEGLSNRWFREHGLLAVSDMLRVN